MVNYISAYISNYMFACILIVIKCNKMEKIFNIVDIICLCPFFENHNVHIRCLFPSLEFSFSLHLSIFEISNQEVLY